MAFDQEKDIFSLNVHKENRIHLTKCFRIRLSPPHSRDYPARDFRYTPASTC